MRQPFSEPKHIGENTLDVVISRDYESIVSTCNEEVNDPRLSDNS